MQQTSNFGGLPSSTRQVGSKNVRWSRVAVLSSPIFGAQVAMMEHFVTAWEKKHSQLHGFLAVSKTSLTQLLSGLHGDNAVRIYTVLPYNYRIFSMEWIRKLPSPASLPLIAHVIHQAPHHLCLPCTGRPWRGRECRERTSITV